MEIERYFDTVRVQEVEVELTQVEGTGLGLVLGSSHFDEHTVVNVVVGSPAEGSVRPNDIIEEVNGVTTEREPAFSSRYIPAHSPKRRTNVTLDLFFATNSASDLCP